MLVEIEDIDINEAISFRLQNEEERKNRHDRVKHFLACFIIILYVLLLVGTCFWDYAIPEAYENLTLIIIGYYFAKFV